MPEGDTLYRIAAELRPVLQDKQLIGAELREDGQNASLLVGQIVDQVRAVGKHLMVHLSGDLVIHSHLGMTGSWHVYRPDDTWLKPKKWAAITLATWEHVVVCFSPKLLEVVTETRLRRNDYLRRLGPDLMLATTDPTEILPRLRVHDRAPIGEVVMNQTVVAGIGNVFKSETLFLSRVNPWTRIEMLDDDVLLRYLQCARRWMRRNRSGGMRRTRYRGDGQRLWVYGRRGEPCFECGEAVLIKRQGEQARTTYWCARCQPSPSRHSPEAW